MEFRRSRIVERPPSAYPRWEMHSHKVFAECGRPVRVLDAKGIALYERAEPLPDYFAREIPLRTAKIRTVTTGRKRPAGRGAVRWLSTAAMLVTVFAALASVGASPFALSRLVGASGRWEQSSFIGRTYGAVSALIAVSALVGISGTPVYQARGGGDPAAGDGRAAADGDGGPGPRRVPGAGSGTE
ncbi:DUF6879 family protein [Actinorugispora endophytica]|uniref:DUF6879 family protein n=1 Tax=Actinorugispora endophytica TaxID=1605990 RepID=UPI00312C7122